MDFLLNGPSLITVRIRRNGEGIDRSIPLTLPETSSLSDLVSRAGEKLGLPLAACVLFSDGSPVSCLSHVAASELLVISCGEPFLAPRPKSQEDFAGYRILGRIGNGGFGTVFRAEDANGETRAIKVLSKLSMRCGVSEMQRVFNEMNALRNLKHPNIIEFHEIVENRDSYGLVMDFANGGDLLRHVETKNPAGLCEEEAQSLFGQIVKAVNYCHSLNITHGDIKLNNVVLMTSEEREVSKPMRAVLLDFGLAQFVSTDHKTRTDAGTQAYIAPEVHMRLAEDFDPYKIDVWALGVVLYFMTQGKLPFPCADERACVSLVNQTLVFRFESSVNLRALVLKLLTVDPKDRPTLPEISVDIWLRNGRVGARQTH